MKILKERGVAAEVVALSCGGAARQDTLRTALALGANRAILVPSETELQPLAVAKLVAGVVNREDPRLVIAGKQAIDDDANQVGQIDHDAVPGDLDARGVDRLRPTQNAAVPLETLTPASLDADVTPRRRSRARIASKHDVRRVTQ